MPPFSITKIHRKYESKHRLLSLVKDKIIIRPSMAGTVSTFWSCIGVPICYLFSRKARLAANEKHENSLQER